MRLAQDRFFKGQFNFKRTTNSKIEKAPRFTYETHNALYDIVIIDGHKYYSKNMGILHNTIDKITPIHVKIEQHFNI